MKKLKKLLSIVLAVAMVMSLAVSVTASSYSITIKSSDTTGDHTYYAYQIFDGDWGGSVLSNITWGSGIDITTTVTGYSSIYAYLATIKAENGTYPFTSDHSELSYSNSVLTSAAEVAEALASSTYYNDSTVVEQFAAIVANYLTTTRTPVSWDSGESKYYAEITDPGYYLIVDETTLSSPTSDAKSAYMVQVVDNAVVAEKKSVPSMTKTVTDVNDSDGTTSTGNSADYDIGDSVPFTLTAILGDSYYEKYDEYSLTFHDTLSSGLTYDENSVVVTVYTPFTAASGATASTDTYEKNSDGTFTLATGSLTEGDTYYTGTVAVSVYTVATSNISGESLQVQITDTNKLYANGATDPITVTSGSIITVDYTATLTLSASYQENNEAYITYSNDPNSTSTGTSEKSKTYVYDYSLTIKKTDGTYALDGAEFTLYKKVILANASDADASTTYYENAGDTTGTLGSALTSGGTYYVAYTAKVTGSNGTTASGGSASADTFTFSGLDDGEYVLVESKTPSGYNTMENVTFYIIAEHDGSTLTSLIAGSASNATSNMTNWNASTSGTDIGSITATIENNAGSNLPETGGIGVTIFYVVGGILVLAAAGVIVITKRKAKAEK